MYLSLAIYFGLIVVGIVIWKKYNAPRFFWYLFPIVGLLSLSVLEHFSEIYLQLSDDQRAIKFFILTSLRIAAVIALLLITLKRSFK